MTTEIVLNKPVVSTVEFTVVKEKETKGTFRFKEVEVDGLAHCSTIYFKKSSPASKGNKLLITVKVLE